MAIADRRSIRRIGGVLLTALTLCLAGSVQPAAAQGLFEVAVRRLPPACAGAAAAATSSYADPLGLFGSERPAGEASGFGHGTVYCVRTCDGRYFPLQRHAGATPAELCKSFCPAAKTMVFSGSKIDTAVAPNGTRYADLDNAFAYRDKVGRQLLLQRQGRARARAHRVPPAIRPCGRATSSPPTTALQPTHGKSRTAEFTPIGTSSSEWARRAVRGQGAAGAAEPSRSSRWPNDEAAEQARKGRAQRSVALSG